MINARPHNLRCDDSWLKAGESLTPCLLEKPLGRVHVPVPKPTQVGK
jgi:hypothetical protein